MGMAEFERKREEKIDGVIYDMSPSHDYRHGIINNNINRSIGCGLKNSLCLVLMENLDYKYQPEVNDDYVCPDVMVPEAFKRGSLQRCAQIYCGDIEPFHGKKGSDSKKEIYEKAGVEEFWIVSPQGAVEIYYLQDGKYELEQNYMLQKEMGEEDYNADTEIALRAFPEISMILGEIFQGV